MSQLLFPPRRRDRWPGRYCAASPIIRTAGPARLLAPAEAALQSAGITLVTDYGPECSTRCGDPDRGLVDKATANWVRLLADSGPERFAQAYCIVINENGIVMQAGGPAGMLYGLLHIAEVWDGGMDCGVIADWPEIEHRCVLLDVSRGRVPRLSFLRKFIDLIASLRYNQLTFNIEHVLMPFDGDPSEAEIITPEEIAAVDRMCRERAIEYIPFQQSLGHLRGILRRPEYRGLAYDPARLWSIDPGNADSYRLLGMLYDRQCAVTTSPLFHAGCDEPFDMLRSYDPGRYGGRPREEVIVDHIARVAEMLVERGRQAMVWADALPSSPELLRRLPDNLVLCQWHYGTGNLEGIEHYRQKLGSPDRPFYACGTTWSFVKPFPDLSVMRVSNDGLFATAREAGPMGMMTTIWGDMGHANLPGLELYPLAYAARHGWSAEPPTVPPEQLTGECIAAAVPNAAYALPLARLLHGAGPDLDMLPLLLDGINRAFTGPMGMGGIGTLLFHAEPFALPFMPPAFQLDRLLRLISSAARDAGQMLAKPLQEGVRGKEFLRDGEMTIRMADYLAAKVCIIHSLRSVPLTASVLKLSAGECGRIAGLLQAMLAFLEQRWLENHKRSGFDANQQRFERLIQAWRDREAQLAGLAADLSAGRTVPDAEMILSRPPTGYNFDVLAEIGLKDLIV